MKKHLLAGFIFFVLPMLVIANNTSSFLLRSDFFLQDTFPERTDVELTNMEELNSSSLDFSPILYQDGIIFSSSRRSATTVRKRGKWVKEQFSDLFFAKNQGINFSTPIELDGTNERFHDGTATFNSSGDIMIFAGNSKKGKSKKGIRDLKLYEAQQIGNSWTNIKSLELNDNEFSTCHPTLSADEKRLYFSSNRPGGFGKMDIYVSYKLNDQWSEPQNLGPTVNSAGNEIFPVIHDDEKLYYSSDGHPGVGGLDIFVAEKIDATDESSWTRRNMGKPFNSQGDDMSFISEVEGKSGYLASNRKGGKGKDDIYRWTMTGAAKKMAHNFCVYDIQNRERLEGVEVNVLPADLSQQNEDLTLTLKPVGHNKNEFVLGIKKKDAILSPNNIATSNKNGLFQYEMESEQDYFFILNKKGYGLVQHQTNIENVSKRNEYCIAMARQSCVTVKGKVKNKTYDRLIPFAEINFFNRHTGEAKETRADENGEFEICIAPNNEFEILGSKDRFQSKQIVYQTNADEADLPLALLELELLDRPALASNRIPQPNYAGTLGQGQPYAANPNLNPDDYVTKKYLLEYFTGNANHVLTVGETFTLKNIYYDFDKYHIRSDAQTELDHVIRLMKVKPEMEISLASHTDSRGKKTYNAWLSQKRAKAAKVYLISKGIDPKRIHGALGMGESQQLIECSDCSEEDHQMNRRTEITIVKI